MLPNLSFPISGLLQEEGRRRAEEELQRLSKPVLRAKVVIAIPIVASRVDRGKDLKDTRYMWELRPEGDDSVDRFMLDSINWRSCNGWKERLNEFQAEKRTTDNRVLNETRLKTKVACTLEDLASWMNSCQKFAGYEGWKFVVQYPERPTQYIYGYEPFEVIIMMVPPA